MSFAALNDHENQAFDNRIQTITPNPVLALPRPNLLFVIEKDGNEYQLGDAFSRSTRMENAS